MHSASTSFLILSDQDQRSALFPLPCRIIPYNRRKHPIVKFNIVGFSEDYLTEIVCIDYHTAYTKLFSDLTAHTARIIRYFDANIPIFLPCAVVKPVKSRNLTPDDPIKHSFYTEQLAKSPKQACKQNP